jgi:formamidopyrimidine-DNA glycosylase
MLQDTNNISIIDAVQILHTKPVETNTGAFYQYMKHIGVDPSDEYFKVKQIYSSFNGMRTKPKGHLLKAHFLPDFLSYPLVRLGEHYKKRKHLSLLKFT